MEQTGEKYFLKEVTLSGYKSIKETTIDFQSNLSIIIGKNAAGKTNFLEFLNKALNYDFESMYDFKSSLIFTGRKAVSIEAKNNLSGDIFKNKESFSLQEYKLALKIDEAQENYNSSQIAQLYQTLSKENFSCSNTLLGPGIPDQYDIVDKPFSFTIDFTGFSSSLIIYAFKREHPYFIRSLITVFPFVNQNDIANNQITNKSSNEKIRLRLQETAFTKLESIKSFLQQFTPIKDIRFSENFNVFKSEANKSFTITNLFIEYKVNEEWQPFANLSDGTKRLFYIISEVAFPEILFLTNENVEMDKEDTRIILIEEPELGIHPHQLHTLMTFLKEQSQTKQIIITTHSPQVLNILNEDELDSIILAEYENKKGTLLRHMSNAEKNKARRYMKEDYLSDYWMHSNLETTKQSAL